MTTHHMEFKDYFSVQASDYAKFRPDYPDELYQLILQHTANRHIAWDCATGNGQVAIELAKYFDKVLATDASSKQLDAAIPDNKIYYSVATAEHSGLADHSVDLITVGQALHWFDFDAFYTEARRVAKPGALLAVFSYGVHSIEPTIDEITTYLYSDLLGPYWPKERRYIDELYTNIPFPFEQIEMPILSIAKLWDLRTLVGYLFTWSSTQQYIKTHGTNPLELIQADLTSAWGAPSTLRTVTWPLAIKAALIK